MDLATIAEYVSKIPQYLTNKTTELITNQGFNVTERWTSSLFLLFSFLLIYLALKITKPLLKWAIIVLLFLVIIGIFTPSW